MIPCKKTAAILTAAICVGLQSEYNTAAGCVHKPRPCWRHFPTPLLLPQDINHAWQTDCQFFCTWSFLPSWDRDTEWWTDKQTPDCCISAISKMQPAATKGLGIIRNWLSTLQNKSNILDIAFQQNWKYSVRKITCWFQHTCKRRDSRLTNLLNYK